MLKNPVTSFVAVSIDAIRDTLGVAPPVLSLGSALVHTTTGRAGNGERPFFLCPGCKRRVLLLFLTHHGGSPACRHCHRIAYPGQWLRGTPYEVYLAEIRRSSA